MNDAEMTARDKILAETLITWEPNTAGEWTAHLGPLKMVVLANQYQVDGVWRWTWQVNLDKSVGWRDKRTFRPVVGWGESRHDAQRLAEGAARAKFMELRRI
jgi:hypothetical protein